MYIYKLYDSINETQLSYIFLKFKVIKVIIILVELVHCYLN